MTRPQFLVRLGAWVAGITLVEGAQAQITEDTRIEELFIRWTGIGSAERYEVRVDGQVVRDLGRNARTTRVPVDMETVIEIEDLPNRSFTQVIEFVQIQE